MSSPASTPSRRRSKRGRGSNPPTRKCFGGDESAQEESGRSGGQNGAAGGPGGSERMWGAWRASLRFLLVAGEAAPSLRPRRVLPATVSLYLSPTRTVAAHIKTPAPGLLVSCSTRCSVSAFAEAPHRRLHLHRRPAAHAHLSTR